jgi:hypothetical protein
MNDATTSPELSDARGKVIPTHPSSDHPVQVSWCQQGLCPRDSNSAQQDPFAGIAVPADPVILEPAPHYGSPLPE